MKQSQLPFLIFIASLLFSVQFLPAQEIIKTNAVSTDSVINWLKTGNTEFKRNNYNLHSIDTKLRMELSKAQHPKAVILTCSDSRVPPELVFNKGLGDLFVIRVAGNITDNAVLGSIEYAAEHLHTQLVVVMGHTSCGAIAAAVNDLKENDDHGSEIKDHVRELTGKIEEAVTFANEKETDPVKNALISNIKYTITILRNSHPTLNELIRKNELKIVGAVYHLDSGEVEWLNY